MASRVARSGATLKSGTSTWLRRASSVLSTSYTSIAAGANGIQVTTNDNSRFSDTITIDVSVTL